MPTKLTQADRYACAIPVAHATNFRLFRIFLLSLLFLGFTSIDAAYAQTKVAAGVVRDEKGEPMSGVSVVVKGRNKGVFTDGSGLFSIAVPNDDAVLVFSYTGYKTFEAPAKGSDIAVNLAQGNAKLDEVVVVGYGSQKKVTVTGAVATVKGAELEKSPSVNLTNSLAGRLPGISAVQAGGEPGYDGSTIRIRGVNTLGNTNALVVVDGVPDAGGGLERINPADIESMSVLKDAAAAIYGVRAANGVILVTTKRGKSGKPQVAYNFNQGFSQPSRTPQMANAVEYAEMNNETAIYDNVPSAEWAAANTAIKSTGSYTTTGGNNVLAPFQPADIQKYKDGSDKWGHPNTDWFKETLKTWSPQSQHTLQVRGGSEDVRYLASLNYINQDGYYKQSATGYKQYDGRVNLDAKINNYINTSIGVTYRQEDRFYPTNSAGSIFRMLMRGRPTEPEFWPNGLPGPDIENGQNPAVITRDQTGYSHDNRTYFLGIGKVEFKIPGVEGLKLTGTVSMDRENQTVKLWQIPWSLYFWDHSTYEADGVTPVLTKSVRSTFTSPQLNEDQYNTQTLLTSAFINYDHKFGDHSIALMAATTKETDKQEHFGAYRTNFLSPYLDQLTLGGKPQQNVTGDGYNRSRLSYFGRAAYNYKEKYLAEFLWRYDGTYLFPSQARFGFFPGFLAGWRISEEKFFKQNVHFIDNLKIRASYGKMGNDQVYYRPKDGGDFILKEYQFLNLYSSSNYVIGGQGVTTLAETVVPNPSFTWETANNSDIGLEGSMLNGKINFEFDVFYNKRTSILWTKRGSTPSSSGIQDLLPPENIGRTENKGFEFKVGYTGNAGKLQYSVSVNGGYAKNKILYNDEAPGAPPYQLYTGHPYGSNGFLAFNAYQYDGVFKDQAEIDASKIDYTAFAATLRPGDMKFKDVNGDGKITADDQERLNKTMDPTFTGGLNINLQYGNFDLSILFQGATGGLVYFGTESGDIGNYLQYSYNHQWTIDKPSSVDPRLANRGNTYYTGGAAGNNTYFLRNNNYLRLKNVELGYNLPAQLLKKYTITNLRIYAGGLNLATWDKMKIYDPETQVGNGQYYPQSRLINFGVRVSF